LCEYFDSFGDGEGYSSPFVVRLHVWIDTNFSEIEVVVVLFVPVFDVWYDFVGILGSGE